MVAAATSPLPLELKPSTAVQAVPLASSAPAAHCSPPLACATGCLMSCPLAEAGCSKTSAITGTLTCSSGRLPGTSWSFPRISMDPGGIKNYTQYDTFRTLPSCSAQCAVDIRSPEARRLYTGAETVQPNCFTLMLLFVDTLPPVFVPKCFVCK